MKTMDLVKALDVADAAHRLASEALAKATGFHAMRVKDHRGLLWGYAPVYDYENGKVVPMERPFLLYVVQADNAVDYSMSSCGETRDLGDGVRGAFEAGYDSPSVLHMLSADMRDDAATERLVFASQKDFWCVP